MDTESNRKLWLIEPEQSGIDDNIFPIFYHDFSQISGLLSPLPGRRFKPKSH